MKSKNTWNLFARGEKCYSKLKQLINIVDPRKEDTYQEGLLVANWAQIKKRKQKTAPLSSSF